MPDTDVQTGVGGTRGIRSTRAIQAGKIPSLDGLRAVSILMVIASHYALAYGRIVPLGGFAARVISLFNLGYLGVTVFFVISGYLITNLLLSDIARNSTIDLNRFYFRRTMRIFPPLYAYLAVLLVCGTVRALPVSKRDLWPAAVYMSDYIGTGWFTRHTWSLAVEEQFYLLWPVCLRYVSIRHCRWICCSVICLCPFARLLGIEAGEHGLTFYRFHEVADSLATGCLLELSEAKCRVLYEQLFFRGVETLAIFFVIALALWPSHPSLCPVALYSTVGISAINLGVGIIIVCAVLRRDGCLVRILNTPAVAAIGVLSYSLYLWQQSFTNPDQPASGWHLVESLFCLGLVAALSYWVVERPSLRLRTIWEKSLFEGRPTESFRASPLSEQMANSNSSKRQTV